MTALAIGYGTAALILGATALAILGISLRWSIQDRARRSGAVTQEPTDV